MKPGLPLHAHGAIAGSVSGWYPTNRVGPELFISVITLCAIMVARHAALTNLNTPPSKQSIRPSCTSALSGACSHLDYEYNPKDRQPQSGSNAGCRGASL